MLATLALFVVSGVGHRSYQYDAQFVEGCSCKDVCITEITGRDAGCHGLGGIQFRTGTFEGHDLSGTAAAFAWDSGKWVSVVIDAPPAKRKAVSDLMRAFLADWGKMEPVVYGKVSVQKAAGGVSLSVDAGKTASLTVSPVMGGDGKSAVELGNLGSPIHSVLFQGKTVKGAFVPHDFSLIGTNGFYNLHCRMKGKI